MWECQFHSFTFNFNIIRSSKWPTFLLLVVAPKPRMLIHVTCVQQSRPPRCVRWEHKSSSPSASSPTSPTTSFHLGPNITSAGFLPLFEHIKVTMCRSHTEKLTVAHLITKLLKFARLSCPYYPSFITRTGHPTSLFPLGFSTKTLHLDKTRWFRNWGFDSKFKKFINCQSRCQCVRVTCRDLWHCYVIPTDLHISTYY